MAVGMAMPAREAREASGRKRIAGAMHPHLGRGTRRDSSFPCRCTRPAAQM